MTGAHLPCREATFGAIVESHQHGREILHRHIDCFKIRRVCGRLECFARDTRLLALRHDSGNVAENVRDAKPRHVLREIAPVRTNVA